MIDISTRRRGRRALRLIAAPVGLVALVGLAACGTGTDASTSAPSAAEGSAAPAAAGGPSDSAMAAYTSCLAENGVTLPERPDRGSGAPPSGAPAASGDGGTRGGPGGGAPGQAPEGVDADTWAAAQQACADVAPTPPDRGGPAGTGT